MATARIEEVLPVPPPKKVILELSEDEADYLRWTIGKDGYDLSSLGARLHQEIWNALYLVTDNQSIRGSRFRE